MTDPKQLTPVDIAEAAAYDVEDPRDAYPRGHGGDEW